MDSNPPRNFGANGNNGYSFRGNGYGFRSSRSENGRGRDEGDFGNRSGSNSNRFDAGRFPADPSRPTSPRGEPGRPEAEPYRTGVRPEGESPLEEMARSASPRGELGRPEADQPTIKVKGYLEILPDYGILRASEGSSIDNAPLTMDKKASESDQTNSQFSIVNSQLPKDVYISQSQIRRFDLRMGDKVEGIARPPREGERYLSLLRIEKVMDKDPDEAKKRPRFENLTPIFPNEQIKLETDKTTLSTRLIDLVAPIGKGQRAMIVSPPKSGKTWLLKEIASGITKNHPEIVLLVALIGERPEEVTDIRRSVQGEVMASNFDEPAEDHTSVAEICLEKAKRLAEAGDDVVILLDSVTRLARAYNMVVPPSGRTLSGGFDPAAIYPPKHFFGAARNLEKPGGSLTIIATALVDTGSRMDDLIYEEFKGTGNMELHLERKLANRRVYPAIDIKGSGTRHEELLFEKKTLEKIFTFRRMVDILGDDEATEIIIERLRKTETNKEFLETLNK